ncbi:MAG: recombinase family protein [Proteobacteria bacterium]|nr:recombinase family protein [Pseudomonadota bacterium]
MKVALYARYSSERQRDSSIADQFRNCERFLEDKNWEIAARYQDAAKSGATADRPGYQEMVGAAKDGRFDILVVDDLSRLSRDEIETKQLIRRFRYWGLRIIGASDGFDTDSKGYKVHAGVRGLINEIYLDDLRDKTHRGLMGQALKGNNCGGRTYGYEHYPIEHETEVDEYGRRKILAVKKRIFPEEARWVRQIFTWFADGRAPRWIAAELNRLGVPSARGRKWAGSTIYGDMKRSTGLLNNDLYIGRYVWNRSKWLRDPDSGRRKRVERPPAEWAVMDLPELRIISHELWARVKERQKLQYDKSRKARLQLHRNARTGAAPKYLFSGLLKCGICGANYVIVDRHRYGCSAHVNKGPAACNNSIKVPRKLIEERLLNGIKNDLFSEEGIDLFKREVARLLTEHRSHDGAKHREAQGRLEKVDKEINNIIEAIKAGILTTSTKSALENAEAEKTALKKSLAAGDGNLAQIGTVLPDAVDRFRDLVDDLENVLQRDVAQGRAQLRSLLGQQIRLHPTNASHLEAEVVGDYAGLVSLTQERPGGRSRAGKLSLVAGARNRLYLLIFAPNLPLVAS